MSDPFRSEEVSLAERLRRVEAELTVVAQADAALAPERVAWRKETRRRSLALVITLLASLVLGSFTGFAMARNQTRDVRRREAESLEAKARKEERATDACHTVSARALGSLYGCLHVTDRALASRVELHIYGEHLGSPVRREMFQQDIGPCAVDSFRVEVTFERTGQVSLVKLPPIAKHPLTTAETLCLDHVFRSATLPPWDGPPMLVVADYKLAR